MANKETVLFKRFDEGGRPYWCMTRVAAYYRYKRTIQPLDELLKSLDEVAQEVK